MEREEEEAYYKAHREKDEEEAKNKATIAKFEKDPNFFTEEEKTAFEK